MRIDQVAHIGEYLHKLRQKLELSQNQVAELGGPYRQAQAAIESGESIAEITNFARQYDRAYRWPLGMTELLHRHIQAGQTGTTEPGETYTAQYSNTATGEPPRIATLGFLADPGPDYGRPAYLDPELTLVTNGHPLAMTSLARSRAGITFVDTSLDSIATRDGETGHLRDIHKDLVSPYAGPDRETVCYQVGAGRADSFGDAITVDPTRRLTSTRGARALAAGLIAAAIDDEPAWRVDAIAYTLLGIAAYGGGMRTVTDLHLGNQNLLQGFSEYWRSQFYNPDQAGPALASPDRKAAALLSGLLAARDRDTTWRITEERRPAMHVSHSGPALVDAEVWDLSQHIIITYDAQLAPEVPVAVTGGVRTGALHYYAADLSHPTGSHAVGQYLGSGIGITEADDDAVLAARDLKTATLTHWIGSTAIYSPPVGFPRRIYLPDR